METSYELHFLLLYLSLGLGIFLGLVYDVFKLFRLLDRRGEIRRFCGGHPVLCVLRGLFLRRILQCVARRNAFVCVFSGNRDVFALLFYRGRLTEKAARKVVSVVRPRLYRAKKRFYAGWRRSRVGAAEARLLRKDGEGWQDSGQTS